MGEGLGDRCPFPGSAVCVGVGIGVGVVVGVGPGVPAAGVGVRDGVGAGCEGTGEGLDTGLPVVCPTGVAAGAGATWWAVAGGVDEVVGEAAGAAGGPDGATACWRSKAASGSMETVMSFGDAAGEAAVVAGVSGIAIGLSCPTRPADDAVPSRPVLPAIAPTAAVSVRPIAPAAAIADLLGIMATSLSSLPGVPWGFEVLGNVRTSVETGLPGAGRQLVKVSLSAGKPLPAASNNWGMSRHGSGCKF